jgi:hypothetical protein
MVVYLVRSSRTYARNRSLTTGTFNLVVKDRIAFRLSGAPSVQANSLLERIRLSSKPYKHTVHCETLSIRASHSISTCFPHAETTHDGSTEEPESSKQHATVWSSALDKFRTEYSVHAETEDRKLRKDPIGGPCFEGTLQKPTSVSESSPVAGTTENFTLSANL